MTSDNHSIGIVQPDRACTGIERLDRIPGETHGAIGSGWNCAY